MSGYTDAFFPSCSIITELVEDRVMTSFLYSFIFWSSQLHNDKAGQRPAAALAAKTLSLALPCVQSIEDSEVLRQIGVFIATKHIHNVVWLYFIYMFQFHNADELARIIASSVIFELHQPDKPAHINTKCIELIKWVNRTMRGEWLSCIPLFDQLTF